MGGPWFTVQKNGTWGKLAEVWISNGKESIKATVEIKVEMEEITHE